MKEIIDLTDEQFEELYGYNPSKEDEDEDYDEPVDLQADINWRPDFSKWVAISDDNIQDCKGLWMISPKIFWDNNHFIPDWCLGFRVPGFYEAREHTLGPKMSLDNPEEALRRLGFTIIKNPMWGWDIV